MPMVTEEAIREIAEDKAVDYVSAKLNDTHRSAKKKDFTAVLANTMEVLDTLSEIMAKATGLRMDRGIEQVREPLKDPNVGKDPGEPEWKKVERDANDAVKLWKQFNIKAHKSHITRVVGEVVSALAEVLSGMGKRKPWVAGRNLGRLAAELHVKAVKLSKEVENATG